MIALLESRQAGFWAKKYWPGNLVAGMLVSGAALPLAMAFAIASGTRPEQGLYSAIVAGFLASVFGGGRYQIAGPGAVFIVILSGVTAEYGIAGVQIVTLLAGVILVAMGMTRLGSVIKYFPDPVVVGFTGGVGVIVWIGQWKDFFGLRLPTGGESFLGQLDHLLSAFPTLHPATTGLAILSLVLLIVSPRIFKRVPEPLVAMVGATVVQALFRFDGVATIGSSFGGIPRTLPNFSLPSLSLSDIAHCAGPAFAIALLCANASLLSATAADGMTGTRHDADQELIGQGLANLFAPLFGGFVAAADSERTATSIRNGATSPLAGMTYSLTLMLMLMGLAPLASYIPLCALAAILFAVAYHMASGMYAFMHLVRKAAHADMAVLLLTFLLTAFSDIVIAINVGIVLWYLLFMRRVTQTAEVRREERFAPANEETAREVPPGVLVYSVDGPFYFGAAEKLVRTLESFRCHTDTLVLRMGRVLFIDAAGVRALAELVTGCLQQKTRVMLVELRANVQAKLARGKVIASVGEENLFSDLDACLDAIAKLRHPHRPEPGWVE